MSLRDYFRVLYYWKGTVLVVFLVIALTAFAASFFMPPVYEAFTLVLVEREPRVPLLHKDYRTASIPAQLSVAEERAELAKTQSEIIKSRYILERIVLNFGLDKRYRNPNQVERAIDVLQDRVKVKLKEETNIIKLSVEDNNPELSAKLTNAVAQEYVKWISETKKTKTKGASGTLGQRVEILDKELIEAEEKLNKLKKAGDVSAIKGEIDSTVAKLADFKAEYDLTSADIAASKARLKEVETTQGDNGDEDLVTIAEVVKNRVVDALKMKLLELRLKRTEIASRYNVESMPLKSVDEEIEQTKKKLRSEITKVIDSVINSIKTDLSAFEARKATLNKIKTEYSRRLRQLSDIESEYRTLERKVAGKNELYMTLLGKQAEAALVGSVEGGLLVNVRIVDPAKTPFEPVRPKKLLNTILGCLVGLVGGVSGAFLKEYWDHSVKTVDEVKHHLELSTLAAVPKAKSRHFTLYAPGSPISESFHTLGASVQQLCKGNGINTILVTSASHGEGKTVISANLAVSLSSIEGKKVLMVDANMRKPDLYKFFEVRPKSNLVEVLANGKTIKVDQTDIKNLHLISSEGEAEPSRFLASDTMKIFMRRVKSEYDYVIIDSPALIPYPDASILGFETEGIILVVKFGTTRREAVERAKSLLDKSQRKVLGAVLNNVEYVIPERLYRRI